MGTENLNYT